MIRMPLTGYDEIIKLVPQRKPMLMFDGLRKADELQAVTELSVTSGNIFTDGSVFTVPGLVENIAQTAAAHKGFLALQNDLPVPMGFIAAVKNLVVYRLPSVGEKLRTVITIVSKVLDYVIAEGTVQVSGEKIAGCEMRIFISEADGQRN